MKHMTLTLPPSYAVTIAMDQDATEPSLSVDACPTPAAPVAAAPGTGVTWPADVEAMLRRFERNGKTKKWPHRAVAEHLQAAGFEPDVPATGTRPYLRWHVDGTTRSLSVYQQGTALSVDSAPLLKFALTLPGAKHPDGSHPKVTWQYATSLDDALEAATRLRAHADE